MKGWHHIADDLNELEEFLSADTLADEAGVLLAKYAEFQRLYGVTDATRLPGR